MPAGPAEQGHADAGPGGGDGAGRAEGLDTWVCGPGGGLRCSALLPLVSLPLFPALALFSFPTPDPKPFVASCHLFNGPPQSESVTTKTHLKNPNRAPPRLPKKCCESQLSETS